MTEPLSEGYATDVASEVLGMMGRRRIKQATVAEALGISQAALSRRLNRGRPVIDVAELATIADVLDCSVSDLLPRLDSNQQPSDDAYVQVIGLRGHHDDELPDGCPVGICGRCGGSVEHGRAHACPPDYSVAVAA